MQSSDHVHIAWDTASPISANLVAVLKQADLSPRPTSLSQANQTIAELEGPVVFVVSANSFASVDAILSFKESLTHSVTLVLRFDQSNLNLAIDAVKRGIEEVIAPEQDSAERWRSIAETARIAKAKKETYVFVDELSQHLLALVERVGSSEVNALMVGPTGSGKEVLARLAHHFSPRKSGPFVAVNCAALPETLAESLMFGHAKGAFTGASKNSIGFFEQGEGGTIFLDEIGELPITVQAKLLRAIQEKEVTPVGSSKTRSVDVRILAATNRDLRTAIRNGQFREDLYFRVSTFKINVPPLKDRADDILPLTHYFLSKHDSSGNSTTISPEALGKLLSYEWPGNVRELENVIQRAVVLSYGEQIKAEHLFFDEPIDSTTGLVNQKVGDRPFVEDGPNASAALYPSDPQDLYARSPRFSSSSEDAEPNRDGLQAAVDASEFRVIFDTLRSSRTRREAAHILGISERTLRYKIARMRERGIDIPKRKMV